MLNSGSRLLVNDIEQSYLYIIKPKITVTNYINETQICDI
jgi:hypothetical protein